MSKKDLKAAQPSERARALDETRNEKMARSVSGYVRGAPQKFYLWLAESKKDAVPEGPRIWICGDCHCGNIGPCANDQGEFAIEIRDFDQTVIGNPAYDLVRLGLSLASAAMVSDLPGVTIADILESMMRSYEMAFQDGFDAERDLEQPKAVRRSIKEAKAATWKSLIEENAAREKPVLPLGSSFWPVSDEERSELDKLFRSEDMRALATLLSGRKDHADIDLIDAAYWKKGCSSLGQLRYAALLEVGGKRNDRAHCFMDLKAAAKALAPHAQAAAPELPADHARRVVAGARKLSLFLGERMRAVKLMGKSMFVRELLPQDLKIDIEQLDRPEARMAAGFLAAIVGKAHARQMDAGARKDWKAELARGRTKSLDAPSWLWRDVVELLADHERGYLEHCRRFSLAA